MVVFSIVCIGLGIAVFVVPATFISSAAYSGAVFNETCPAVTPATTPATSAVPVAGREAFVKAWEAYTNETATRTAGPTVGLRFGCEPMRFPATAPYRGVAVVWHGFSSCPQEMSHLGPPLAAAGYDAVFPLMAGHGNSIVYVDDAPGFLWSYLGAGVALLVLFALLVSFVCPFAACCQACCLMCCTHGAATCEEDGKCGYENRRRCLLSACCLFGLLLLLSIIGIAVITAGVGDSDFCFSLSFVDGLGPGCGGMSEYNDNLPASRDGYEVDIDRINAIVALAPGSHVVTGLSGGAGAAIYAGMATKNGSSGVYPPYAQPAGLSPPALYARQLFVAPYLDVAIIGPYLSPAISLGMGELKVDFGEDCRVTRRGAGKAGYCNYRLNRIDGMRQVAQHALSRLAVPPGASIETLKVEGDGTVTNADIHVIAQKWESLSANTSSCSLEHVDSLHSPLAMWNTIHQDVEYEWIPELICQITAFLADGVPMPVDNTTTGSDGWDVCYSSCDVTNCTFDCATDSFVTCP